MRPIVVPLQRNSCALVWPGPVCRELDSDSPVFPRRIVCKKLVKNVDRKEWQGVIGIE